MRGVQHYTGEIKPAPPVLIWSLYSGVTSFTAMAIIGIIHKYGAAIRDHNLPFAIAPTGASAVLLFAVPSSPLAQPRNVILGHLIAAQMGVFMYELFKHVEVSLEWLPGALAVGLAIFFMGLTNCYHPPAGATAYLAGYFSADVRRVGWWFPLYPVLPVVLIMVSVAIVVNNLVRVYPVYWFTTVHYKHTTESQVQAPKVVTSKEDENDPDSDLTTSKPDTEESSRSSSVDLENEVNSVAGNEEEAQVAWMMARIHELEHELNSLRAHHAHTVDVSHAKTCQPEYLA
ncbi:hypothetical protein LPJ73_005388 [Coemansia sp. RSA 2703]|nr:hypothetical protein LPJ73_005388 [Coemansia sp. RSA 2703]KAJ2383611.1 hypothetical protein GGI05_005259 [Coemansia sp. RSA 2603]